MNTLKEAFADNDAFNLLECVPEKFVVDFANGIDVLDDHLRSQQNRSTFQRFKEGISGKSSARQQQVNATLRDGVEASLTWLTELTQSLAKSNLALAQVNTRVNHLRLDIAKLANFSADTREQLEMLSQQVHQRLSNLEEQVHHISLYQRADAHMDNILSRWSAGRYNDLPLLGRCYAVLEELRWGAFGDMIRQGDRRQSLQLLDTLKNRAQEQLARDGNVNQTTRLDTQSWLAWQTNRAVENSWPETMSWIADWCNVDTHPITWSVTQRYDAMPKRMPLLFSAERITGPLVNEVFSREQI